jgi:hypothetical protein
VALNIKTLEVWRDKKMAGTKWFTKFLKRRKTPLNKPEAKHISRASNFNKTGGNVFFFFFDNLKEVLDGLRIGLGDIQNMKEMGMTTVQIPDRLL